MYHFAIEALAWISILVFSRYFLYRSQFLLHMFQLNGYKLNEFWQWLIKHHRQYLVNYVQLVFLLILLALNYYGNALTESAITIIVSLLILFWFGSVSSFLQPQKKPLVLTPRATRLAVLIGFLSVQLPVLGVSVAFWTKSLHMDLRLVGSAFIISDLLIPFIVLVSAFVLSPLETWFQNGFKKKAAAKVRSFDHLKVIAITGSYGKTSTKFTLNHVLKERFKVCFTPGSYNTPMGICKVVNEQLEASDQVLILEMGARYLGNIDELCDIAEPDVSLVTNIGVAHLETFGSQKNIQITKGALVRRLKPGGLAVLNADDPLVEEMRTWRNDVSFLSCGFSGGDFRASEVQYGTFGCRFLVHFPDDSTHTFELPLLGAHNIINALFALAVGHHFGMRKETMALALSSMKPVEHRLELKHQGTWWMIDDAFNSNPVGAKNAVEVLASFRNANRYIVTPGMVELGELHEVENAAFGAHIARAQLEGVLLVGPKQTEPIKQGYLDAGGNPDTLFIFKTLFEANAWLREKLKEGDVVLYENDLPDTYNE